MNGAFYIGATGLHAQERALDVIANNIANMNTTAYKRSEVRFSELVAGPTTDGDVTLDTPSALASMAGVGIDASPRVFTQGDLKQTGKPLDVAINGPGFIELMAPGGQILLSRGGSLKVNADGYLAAENGMPLKAMIQIPAGATNVTIGADGKIQATLPNQTQTADLGQIDIVQAKDETELTPIEGGLFQAASTTDITTAAPGEDGGGTIMQGSVEGSNVQLSDEMVMLMLMQRAYAANAQVVQAGDQLMSIANGLRR